MNQESTNVVPSDSEESLLTVETFKTENSQPDQLNSAKTEETYETLTTALESGDFENVNKLSLTMPSIENYFIFAIREKKLNGALSLIKYHLNKNVTFQEIPSEMFFVHSSKILSMTKQT